VITAKYQEGLEKSTLEISNAVDITSNNRNGVRSIVNKTIKKFAKLDIYVNNARIFSKIKLLH